jgi:predicted MPP superfamily phosphohydrolase
MILAAVVIAQAAGVVYFLRTPAARASSRLRRFIVGSAGASMAALLLGSSLRFQRFAQYLPDGWPSWIRGFVIVWAFVSVLLLGAFALTRVLGGIQPTHHPARRAFLRTFQTALFAGPPAAVAYGVFVQRTALTLREQDLMVPGLPPDLHGLRIVQLTDIHLSPFLSRQELARAVDMASGTGAHLAVVTGDLISTARDPLDECLKELSRLRADAGVLGCLGNHEVYADAVEHTVHTGARLGLRFLRHEAASLRFGDARLNIAGVDYQRFGRPYLRGAEKLIDPGAFNILLSHNPDVFPVAARQGYRITLAGHTHGGQVNVEILHQDLNIARFFTPYVDGLYSQGGASVFVSRGIGTIGMPARLGAPPEVALLRLCRT